METNFWLCHFSKMEWKMTKQAKCKWSYLVDYSNCSMNSQSRAQHKAIIESNIADIVKGRLQNQIQAARGDCFWTRKNGEI